MKTTILAIASLALLAGAAAAKDRCGPATGNWVNAAVITCPDQGSGGVGLSRPSPTKCDYRK